MGTCCRESTTAVFRSCHALSVAWEELGLLRSGSYIIADNVPISRAPAYRAFVRSRCGLLQSRAVKGLIMPGEKEVNVTVFNPKRRLYLFELSIGQTGDHQGPLSVLLRRSTMSTVGT